MVVRQTSIIVVNTSLLLFQCLSIMINSIIIVSRFKVAQPQIVMSSCRFFFEFRGVKQILNRIFQISKPSQANSLLKVSLEFSIVIVHIWIIEGVSKIINGFLLFVQFLKGQTSIEQVVWVVWVEFYRVVVILQSLIELLEHVILQTSEI